MQLPPNPKLRDVTKICRGAKDVNFLDFFDSTKSNLYPTVRHRYNELILIVANGVSHLKLFTKFLQQIISAQEMSSNSCLNVIEKYQLEEPTLSNTGGQSAFVKLQDETSVILPSHIRNDTDSKDQSQEIINETIKKTDIDGFTDIFVFERNMNKLLVMYYKRLNEEIYLPLYEYRKTCINKLESIQEYVSDKYDKLIKHSTKLRENKINGISLWNDLCDLQHTLRKQRNSKNDNNKTKKLLNKIKSLQTKCKKQFENIVENVDKFNNIQSEFWDEILLNACLQLESIEYSRICFYNEYFNKYYELLKWRKAELENGCDTLERSKQMLMTPFEINEYNIHPIRISNGNYNIIQPQQYELPCMPNEIFTLNDQNIIEQRIDPSILIQIFNPFGETLKPSTSRHIKSNYSRQNSMIIHDRNLSHSVSTHSISHMSSPSNSISLSQSQTQTNVAFFNTNDNVNTASKLFSRTNRAQTLKNGMGLPKLLNYNSPSNSISDDISNITTPSLGAIPPPPFNKPPININKPPLPIRNKSTKSPRNSPKPNIPKRPPPSMKTSITPTPNQSSTLHKPPPKLPPRRKTLPNNNNFKRPPKKNVSVVAQQVRKTSSIVTQDNNNNNNNNNSNNNKKKTKKWKIGK